MKKILVIAFACGIFSATASLAQTSKSTSDNATTAAPAVKADEAPAAKTGVSTESSKKDGYSCGSKKSAGKSSCCMKGGKAEAKAETNEEKKAIEQ